MGYASAVATHMVKEGIRKQLAGKMVKQTPNILNKLRDYIVRNELRAKIKDDVYVGLRAPEALVVFISQLTLDAFKAVGDDKEAANIIDVLQDIFQTALNHKRPYITVHFNLEYATKTGYSFTYREAYDTRARFMYTSVADYLVNDGYAVGVLAEYEGDEVPKPIRRLRRQLIEEYHMQVFQPGRWLYLYNALQPDNGVSGCVYMARLVFNKQIMYRQGVVMDDLVAVLRQSLRDIKANPIILASGFSDATIDIFPAGIISNPRKPELYNGKSLEVSKEAVLLGSSVRNNLTEIRVSGIPYPVPTKNACPRVTGVRVNVVQFSNLYTLRKVVNVVTDANQLSSYYIEELGRELWAADQQLSHLSWRDLEYNCYLVNDEVVYSEVELPDSPRATEEDLTVFFREYFLAGQQLADLWVAELKVPTMVVEGVDVSYLTRYFEYAGLIIHRQPFKHGFLDKIGYIYLICATPPATAIQTHFNLSSYTYANLFETGLLSAQARQWVLSKVPNDDPKTIQLLLNIPESLELERINTYTYVTCSTARKGGGTYMPHVMDHAYDQVVRFAWVDRHKTISNDWYNTTPVAGVGIAHNNYMIEPFQEITSCKADIDPRHLISLAAYVFERGFPAGVGLRGITAHGVDFMAESLLEKFTVQIPKAYTRKPASSLAMYSFTGSVASRGYLPIKLKEVAAKERQHDLDSLRSKLRLNKEYQREQLLKNSAVSQYRLETAAKILAIRSKIVEGDPFAGIPIRLRGSQKAPLKVPKDFPITLELVAYNNTLVTNVRSAAASYLQKLRNTKNQEAEKRPRIIALATAPFVDMSTAIDLLKLFWL
jgi:hypothetical protein